jgi:hypothetical protein
VKKPGLDLLLPAPGVLLVVPLFFSYDEKKIDVGSKETSRWDLIWLVCSKLRVYADCQIKIKRLDPKNGIKYDPTNGIYF